MTAVFLKSYGVTDAGKKRRVNEDQFIIGELNQGMLLDQTSLHVDDQTQLSGRPVGKLLAVADGMGGHVGGERASALAIQALTRYVLHTMPWFFHLYQQKDEDLKEELTEVMLRAEQEVRAEGTRVPGRESMGTTLTMGYLLWPRLYLLHIGDSRCYLMRGRKLRQLTTDHSLAQQLVNDGTMKAEDAEQSRLAHVLHKAIVSDGETSPTPDVLKVRLEPGDTLLLCTDGLSNQLDDVEIMEYLGAPVQQAAEALVAEANRRGGPDNVTAVVARAEPRPG